MGRPVRRGRGAALAAALLAWGALACVLAQVNGRARQRWTLALHN